MSALTTIRTREENARDIVKARARSIQNDANLRTVGNPFIGSRSAQTATFTAKSSTALAPTLSKAITPAGVTRIDHTLAAVSALLVFAAFTAPAIYPDSTSLGWHLLGMGGFLLFIATRRLLSYGTFLTLAAAFALTAVMVIAPVSYLSGFYWFYSVTPEELILAAQGFGVLGALLVLVAIPFLARKAKASTAITGSAVTSFIGAATALYGGMVRDAKNSDEDVTLF
jgi:hypothetical protein